MKNISKVIKLSIIAIITCLGFSCSDDDDNVQTNTSKTITELASSRDDLSILVQALDKANLAQTLNQPGNYTVFAPTNTAFANFLQTYGFNSLDDVPVADLKEILLNHVIGTKKTSSQLTPGYISTLAKSASAPSNYISMFVELNNGVKLNGLANVTTADLMASNGVIHIVDSVIPIPNIVDIAVANPDLSILVTALTRADQPDFAGILGGTTNAPFTVFAPTNTAFSQLLTELGLTSLDEVSQTVLENTLKYHVVTGANVLSTDLTNNMVVTTFQGQSFTVTTTNGAQITDANGRTCNITVVDIQGSNGVIHMIDKVILPMF